MEIPESMMTEDDADFLPNDSHKYLTSGSSSFNGNDSFLPGSNGTSPVAPQSRDEELAKIEIAILALIFSFTVLGNFIVILGIYFRRQKMSRMYYFILHLSIADLITAFFNVLTQLIWELTWHFQGGNILCKFIKYAQILGPYSSSYVLIVTAIDRYQAICYPLSNCTWTARRSKLMLAFAWTLSILLCIPQLFIFSYMEVSPGVDDCWGTFVEGWGAKAYVTWYAITVFIIPLIILTFSYSCICRAIWINFSMKNSIRRHQFSRSSRISRDSETENDFCHSMSLVDNNCGGGGENVIGRSVSSRRSVNNKSMSGQYNNLQKRPSSDQPPSIVLPKTLEVSWNRSAVVGEGGGGGLSSSPRGKSGGGGGIPTMTLTTSFSKSPDDLNTGGGGGEGEQMLDLIRYHQPAQTNVRRARYSSSPPDPGETDDDSEMDLDEQTTTSSSPPLVPPSGLDVGGKVHMYPNGPPKYSTSIHPDEISQSRGGGGGGGNRVGGGSKYKFNRNGSNSKNSFNNKSTTAATVKTRTYVWFSAKNSKGTKENHTTPSHVGTGTPPPSTIPSGQSISSSELKPKTRRTFAQFFLPRPKNLKNSQHMIVSKERGGGDFRSSATISTSSFRQPRSSSVKGISRAKIKTVKLTVTVICCYIFCSSPFIAAQLWATYDPDAIKSPFWTGATFTILTLLASLNSCVNPWIFLFFNPNLLQDFLKGFGCSHFLQSRHPKMVGSHSPHSATQMTTASPGLISRASRRDTNASRNSENFGHLNSHPPSHNTHNTRMNANSVTLKITSQGTPQSHSPSPMAPPSRNWEST